MKDIRESLKDEILEEVDTLKSIEVGTDVYKCTVDGVTKLIDRVIEMEKIEIDHNDKEARRGLEADKLVVDIEDKEFDREMRKSERVIKVRSERNEKIDRLVKNGLTAAGIIIPTTVTIWGALKTFEFEKEGTVTTMIGRGFINKLLPKK